MKADEEVPKRPRGRPIRAVSLADCLEKREARDGALTCSMCPKWGRRDWWCPILAEVRKPGCAACKYGKIQIEMKRRHG